MYDYNSFYPWAMTKLPPITDGEWLQTKEFHDEYEGFYLVTGYVSDCKWPLVLKSCKGFVFAKGEKIYRVPMVSYEIREALRNNELTIDCVDGWIWVPSDNSVNPFKDFVIEFYTEKELHRNDQSLYLQYKLILNSLYGKTYQALRIPRNAEEPDLVWNQRKGYAMKNRILYRAGGLYLPHVGAWITSLSRAKLHEDMHRFEAIDCATDSFKTLKDVPTGEDLGDLKFVAEGLLLLVRPKLYVMFSKEIAEKIEQIGDLREYLKTVDIESLRYPEDITKFAHHGFWGNIHQLLELYRDQSNEYLCKHMTRIRESLKQEKNPRVFETQTRGIKVNWKTEVGFCGLKKGVASKTLELCSDQCFNCPYI